MSKAAFHYYGYFVTAVALSDLGLGVLRRYWFWLARFRDKVHVSYVRAWKTLSLVCWLLVPQWLFSRDEHFAWFFVEGTGEAGKPTMGPANSLLANYAVTVLWAVVLVLIGISHRAYLRKITNYLVGPRQVRIRLPLMTATVPILVGLERRIWEDEDINLEPDWRYAGQDALRDLGAGNCEIAVASAWAIHQFSLNPDHSKLGLKVLPFVVVTNHLKIAMKAGGSVGLRQIARKEGTVHDHFLDAYYADPQYRRTEASTLLKGVADLLSEDGTGLLLWEPLYRALPLQKFAFEPNNEVYKWVLCVVARRRTLDDDLARRFLRGLERACEQCTDEQSGAKPEEEGRSLAEVCHRHLPYDVLNIGKDELRGVLGLKGAPAAEVPHVFDIREACKHLRETRPFHLSFRGSEWPGLPPEPG